MTFRIFKRLKGAGAGGGGEYWCTVPARRHVTLTTNSKRNEHVAPDENENSLCTNGNGARLHPLPEPQGVSFRHATHLPHHPGTRKLSLLHPGGRTAETNLWKLHGSHPRNVDLAGGWKPQKNVSIKIMEREREKVPFSKSMYVSVTQLQTHLKGRGGGGGLGKRSSECPPLTRTQWQGKNLSAPPPFPRYPTRQVTWDFLPLRAPWNLDFGTQNQNRIFNCTLNTVYQSHAHPLFVV